MYIKHGGWSLETNIYPMVGSHNYHDLSLALGTSEFF